MFETMQNPAETMKEAALEYLHDKYEDTFTAEAYSASSWAYKYESITFSSEKYPGANIEVRAYRQEDDLVVFTDNYFRYYMMQDAVDYCEDLLGADAASVRIRFPNSTWSDDLEDAKTFTDWKKQGNCGMDTFVITKEPLPEKTQIAFAEALASEKITGMVTFFTTADSDLLADNALNDILNNQSKLTQSKSQYYINMEFSIIKK